MSDQSTDDTEQVTSKMNEQDWQDVGESEFVDIAFSSICGDMSFIFEHPEIGLHGFRFRKSTATLEPAGFERTGGDGDE